MGNSAQSDIQMNYYAEGNHFVPAPSWSGLGPKELDYQCDYRYYYIIWLLR